MSALLQARDLTKHFPARDGRGVAKAVDGVSLSLTAGTTLGIVGESGCGKSTLARLILRLIEPTSGTVTFGGENLSALGVGALRRMRREMQIVFQDPYASLDPRMSVGAIVAEPLDIHAIGTKAERRARVRELLALVGLDADAAAKYPHEFSGGQRQRIGIARAIAPDPKLLILDEPVSALDVSIQSQVLNLLLDIKARLGLSYIFISHDLSVVRHVSDEVAVMYLGRIVERGGAEEVFDAPMHPYTQALVSAVPGAGANRQRIVLAGDPPNPEHVPPGCAFHPRCSHAFDRCRIDSPALKASGAREVACHLY
jgi:peptide/nickel transport system ATP-binding protein/oligopeptide transport system ATP-binding protein